MRQERPAAVDPVLLAPLGAPALVAARGPPLEEEEEDGEAREHQRVCGQRPRGLDAELRAALLPGLELHLELVELVIGERLLAVLPATRRSGRRGKLCPAMRAAQKEAKYGRGLRKPTEQFIAVRPRWFPRRELAGSEVARCPPQGAQKILPATGCRPARSPAEREARRLCFRPRAWRFAVLTAQVNMHVWSRCSLREIQSLQIPCD